MWANYDTSNFPIVHVTFESKINEEKDFNDFLQNWIKLYERKENFTFIFDTRNVGFINISYCFKMKTFLGKIKKLPIQYLEKSIIILNNNYIKQLLNIVFKLQKPIATVYIYNSWDKKEKKDKEIDNNNLLDNINNNKLDDYIIIS
jgi:hypothetical protein